MNKHFLAQTGRVVAGMLLMMGVAAAAEPEHAKNDASAHHFLTEAAQGGLAEVNLGQMAADKSTNEAVKEFGRRMVRDHGKANEELKGLSTTAGVPLATEISTEAKELQQRLSGLSGVEFDRAYMEEMVKDHQKDIAMFETQAEHGQNAQVKEWAKKTLPTLKEHLNLAQSTAKKVSARNTTDQDASGGMSAAVDDSLGHTEKGTTGQDR